MSRWCLRFLGGELRGRTVALKPGANTVGTDGDCDVLLPAGNALPRHLVIHAGELVLSVQTLGTATARLNGAELPAHRRSMVAGDIVSLGGIECQVELGDPAFLHDDAWVVGREGMSPGRGSVPLNSKEDTAPPRPRSRWWWGALLVASAIGAALAASGLGTGSGAASEDARVDLEQLGKRLAAFPETEVVAAGGGRFTVRGYVESRERKRALEEAMQPFGSRVGVSVLAADDIIERARQYVGDPGVGVSYAGRGRLVMTGSVEDDAVRRRIRRLADDLHPAVLVSDEVRVAGPTRPAPQRDAEAHRARWAAWQELLPARMVSIVDGADHVRHIQLANGSRYYEGSVLRSGAQLTRIGSDGLVITPGVSPPDP